MAANRKTMLDDAQRGAVGKLIGVEDPADVSRIVGGLFSRQDAVNQLSRLRGRVRGDREAEEGLRKAVVDHVLERFVGNTEGATSGQAMMKSDSFQTFVKRNGPALHAAGFDNDAIRTMEKVAEDLQRSNRSLNAVRVPGQSNTAQDQQSILQQLASSGMENWTTVAGGTVGASVGGAPGALVGGGMAALVNSLRQNGIEGIDELVKDAMLHPDRARMLLTKLPAAKPEQAESMLRSLARRYTKTAIAAPLIGEREAPKGPMKLRQAEMPDYMRRPAGSGNALTDAVAAQMGGAGGRAVSELQRTLSERSMP